MKSKLSPEDLKLWHAQMRDVKPLSKEEAEATQEAIEKKPSPRPHSDQTLRKKREIQKSVTIPQPFARQDLRRLKIDARLDLHGMTLEKAYEELERFLHRAQDRSLKTVLVITGKGSISSERTLRHQLPLWVKEVPLSQLISSLHYPAKQKDGGGGAFYIGLRRKKK